MQIRSYTQKFGDKHITSKTIHKTVILCDRNHTSSSNALNGLLTSSQPRIGGITNGLSLEEMPADISSKLINSKTFMTERSCDHKIRSCINFHLYPILKIIRNRFSCIFESRSIYRKDHHGKSSVHIGRAACLNRTKQKAPTETAFQWTNNSETATPPQTKKWKHEIITKGLMPLKIALLNRIKIINACSLLCCHKN